MKRVRRKEKSMKNGVEVTDSLSRGGIFLSGMENEEKVEGWNRVSLRVNKPSDNHNNSPCFLLRNHLLPSVPRDISSWSTSLHFFKDQNKCNKYKL